jgi:hypothetical protein
MTAPKHDLQSYLQPTEKRSRRLRGRRCFSRRGYNRGVTSRARSNLATTVDLAVFSAWAGTFYVDVPTAAEFALAALTIACSIACARWREFRRPAPGAWFPTRLPTWAWLLVRGCLVVAPTLFRARAPEWVVLPILALCLVVLFWSGTARAQRSANPAEVA